MQFWPHDPLLRVCISRADQTPLFGRYPSVQDLVTSGDTTLHVHSNAQHKTSETVRWHKLTTAGDFMTFLSGQSCCNEAPGMFGALLMP